MCAANNGRVPGAGDDSYTELCTALLPGGAHQEYPDRKFSDAVPCDVMFPHGGWTKSHTCPQR